MTDRARIAKGRRPDFAGPDVDRLLTIVMEVAGEVSVLHDRIDTIERVAERKGLITSADIEAYRPDERVASERHAWREPYLDRVLSIVRRELDELEAE